MAVSPKVVFCFSGKRKSGKDYVTEILKQRLGNSVVLRLSAPIKDHWAQVKGLDLQQLMSDSPYKERHRLYMVRWGEEQRSRDPGYFCKAAVQMFDGFKHDVWIVSDSRRKTDIEYFKESFPNRVKTVRVVATEEIRAQRGFVFTPGIDDAETECGLDDYQSWDFVVNNNGETLEFEIQRLVNAANDMYANDT